MSSDRSKTNIYKAFSLLEMFMVIIVLGVIFASMRSMFTIPNKHIMEGQICANGVYGALSSHLQRGISGK
jgi:competence protein ComGC